MIICDFVQLYTARHVIVIKNIVYCCLTIKEYLRAGLLYQKNMPCTINFFFIFFFKLRQVGKNNSLFDFYKRLIVFLLQGKKFHCRKKFLSSGLKIVKKNFEGTLIIPFKLDPVHRVYRIEEERDYPRLTPI